jgi:hypothetical protein
LWYPFATRLRAVDNRYVERNVRRIGQTDTAIHELLRLPKDINKQELLHLTNTLMKDVDEFYLRAPLKLLISLPNRDKVLPACDQFYGNCERFAESVTRGSNRNELLDSYRHIDDSWLAFENAFRDMRSRKAHRVLKDIERGVDSLRAAMEIQDGYNDNNIAEMAADIEGLSEHIDEDLRRWFNRQRVSFKNEALQASRDFTAAARDFHSAVVSGSRPEDLGQHVDLLYSDWQRLHKYIRRCKTEDRQHLLSVSAQITPVVVELRTTLAP